MAKYILLLALLVSSPVLALEDDSFREIFSFHKGILTELGQDYVDSFSSAAPVLPKQKNIKTKLSPVGQPTQTAAPPPQNFIFTAKTVWANLTVHLTDFHNHFKVAVESDSPIEGWIIKRISNQEIVVKGGENDAYNFAFEVNQQFNNDYSLTVMVNKDGMTNPALVPLRN